MGTWQRLGTYAAGLALDDAGMKNNEQFTSTMDMIVAASGGERDITVDTQILSKARAVTDHASILNVALSTELRPTLFLAQLSNLLAEIFQSFIKSLDHLAHLWEKKAVGFLLFKLL